MWSANQEIENSLLFKAKALEKIAMETLGGVFKSQASGKDFQRREHLY